MNIIPSIASPQMVFAIILIIIAVYWLRVKNQYTLPPSPGIVWPIVGNLFIMEPNPLPKFAEWRKKHGDILRLQMGSKMLIVINGYKTIKEAFIKNVDYLTDRPNDDSNPHLSQKGIILSSGENWKDQRSTALNILREFGMGKNFLAEKIQEEANSCLEHLEKLKMESDILDIKHPLHLSVSNVISAIVLGKRFEHDDEEFTTLVSKIAYNMEKVSGTSLLMFFPILRFVPGDIFGMMQVQKNLLFLMDYFEQIIIKTKNSKHDERVDSFISSYLDRKKDTEDVKDLRNITKSVFDLFAAGTETSTTTILWFVLYMLYNPGVQEKIFQEIHSEIGLSRKPSIQDKSKLKYLNASICEILRLVAAAPLGVVRECNKDVTINGYTIPKGALVNPNIWSVLHEKAVWGDDSKVFRPERFLDADNNLVQPEEFIPFSFGRRNCLGEALAKMELFLFLATIFQRYKFLPEKDDCLPSLDGNFGITYTPKSFKVKLIDRSTTV